MGGSKRSLCAACAWSQPSVKSTKLLEPTRTALLPAHKDVLRLFKRREPAIARVPSSAPAASPVSTAGALLRLPRAAAAASSSPSSYSTHAIQAAA